MKKSTSPMKSSNKAYVFKWKAAIMLVITFSLLQSCDEDIPSIKSLPILAPTKVDETAGNWKTVLNINASSISLPTAEAISSAAYQAELAELISLSTNRTASQTNTTNYWAAGAVVRWNEIARALVAKYNIAPIVGAPANPNKPFSNPPFAARAYALLSVAQYDALVTSWKFKYQINRPAPASTNASINLLTPETTLPSFPSEHAVVAEASRKVLEFLFPAEKEYLQKLADENKNSRKWAGANTQSDLDAGTNLGSQVATLAINRAKTDRMSQAGSQTTFIDYFKITRIAESDRWTSLELPYRPPMLPLYGKVKTWYDSLSAFAALPPAPPALTSVEFKNALQEVRKIADERTREQWRIADFWADGAGTFTPPGHWNLIAQELIIESKWSEVRSARVFSLMNRAVMDAGILCWYSKYQYYLPRPSQVDPAIKTATGIPNFPSYTSGHASFSGAAATLLAYLFPTQANRLLNQADEAALSRLYGGIHYRFDNDRGKECGAKIGQLAVAWAQADGAN
jgi:membrane-associated phospholipid phosphatase